MLYLYVKSEFYLNFHPRMEIFPFNKELYLKSFYIIPSMVLLSDAMLCLNASA